MNINGKRIISILIILLIAFGFYSMFNGVGGSKPLKDKVNLGLDIKGGAYVLMEAQTDKKGAELKKLMDQTQAVIEKRVNALGLSEPTITIEGEKRLRIEMPGAENTDDAIKKIGKTAQLKFLLADESEVLTGKDVKNASTEVDQNNGGYLVNLEFTDKGAKLFEEGTKEAISKAHKPKDSNLQSDVIIIKLDDKVISSPQVQGVISGGTCQITSGKGGFRKSEATELSALIRGGALPVAMKEVSSSQQDATIGYNAFEKSVKAGIIGVILIFILMVLLYRVMGLVANLALLAYIVILVAVMALMGSTLTLPGIAGIVLSIGMAVDANVIIFTRIREELSAGGAIRPSCENGFKNSMSTIIDSQITTFIAAVVLYQLGTSLVKGFAWTLMIGIAASILTAVILTRLFMTVLSHSNIFADKKFFGVKKDNKISFELNTNINFIKIRKIAYIISIVVFLIGGGIFIARGYNYGIDFTGGTMMHVDMHKVVDQDKLKSFLKKNDVAGEVIYAGKANKEVIVRTRKHLDRASREKLLEAMHKEYKIDKKKDIKEFNDFGPSIGKLLRQNAIKALTIAAVLMLVYIRIRFRKWRFGGAALIGVIHDVLIMLAFYSIFYYEISNPFIAAILTVFGYSINDTIVIFDRIRENNKYLKKGAVADVINKSINSTLSRSIVTSLTTMIVMVPLLIFTSDVIRSFTIPLMIGVATGTYSSVFICGSLYYDFTNLFTGKGGKGGDTGKASGKKKNKKKDVSKAKLDDGAVV